MIAGIDLYVSKHDVYLHAISYTEQMDFSNQIHWGGVVPRMCALECGFTKISLLSSFTWWIKTQFHL